MSYIAQQTRVSSLTIGGEDVTDQLVSFTVSDSSANRNGIISTTGTVVLGQRPGAADITNYSRREYKRGVAVVLDMKEPDGTVFRHPRGYLYVIATTYNVENEQLQIEVGCKLALTFLTDQPEDLLPLVPVPLDATQREIGNVAASFQAVGQVLWQDNSGDLKSGRFFGDDNSTSIEAGKWVSVLGTTALSVSVAASAGPIPDKIKLSYNVPAGLIEEDDTGRVDTVTEVSNYFIDYPAVNFQRVPDGGATPCEGTNCGGFPDDGDNNGVAPPSVITYPPQPSKNTLASSTSSTTYLSFPTAPSGGCGNTPTAPGGSAPVDPGRDENQPPPVACDDLWTTVTTPTYLPAIRRSKNVTEYKAVGAQVSRVYSEQRGPAVEANNQYWADKFAYCRNLYGRACDPNGGCEYEGMQEILQSYSEQTNYYGTANELVKTVVDTYYTTLSAAEPFNWRSGIDSGVSQDFQTLSLTEMYRANRTVTEYSKRDNVSYEKVTNYDSVISRGVGIADGESIDALDGIVTSSLRASSSTTSTALRPDSVNSGSTQTKEKTTDILLASNQYTSVPEEAGPLILEESVPTPYLFTTDEKIEEAVGHYEEYIKRMTIGQARAIQVGEALRKEIVTDWKPGMPFRYVDESSGFILGMRMDGCAWGVTQESSGVVCTGVWTGESMGTYVPGSNIVGNATPNLEGGSSTAPSNTIVAPSITNDVIAQSFSFEVDVEIMLGGSVGLFGKDGVVPPSPVPAGCRYQSNFMVMVQGQTVTSGGLISPNGDGGIPVSAQGTLVVSNSVLVNDDLFESL